MDRVRPLGRPVGSTCSQGPVEIRYLRAPGTVFLFLTWEAITLSLHSERLGNTRRRVQVCVFY
jgi:hypothetical protein